MINNTNGQGNFIENLTAAWRSHTAIGLGVQTFCRMNTHKSISKHLGKAISRLTNELAKSQDLIAHFLTFKSASNHFSKHIQTTLDYIRTLTKGSKSTQLSSFISSDIKQSLLNKLDLDLNTNRKTRVLTRIINKSDFKAQFKTSITKECHTDNSALEYGCMTLRVTINIYLPKNKANRLVLNLGSDRLVNPLHKNNENYLYSNHKSILFSKHLKIKPNQNIIGLQLLQIRCHVNRANLQNIS